MKELGKLSAKARGKPRADRVHESLRDYLKKNVAPSEVWAAIQATLVGGSESARVSASRLLVDALHTPHDEHDWRKQLEAQMTEAARQFELRIERRTSARRGELEKLLATVGMEELAGEGAVEIVRALVDRLLAIPEAERREHAPS